MYISHAAHSEETVRGSKMPSFEGCRFGCKMFVAGREFEGCKLDELLCLRVFGLEDDH